MENALRINILEKEKSENNSPVSAENGTAANGNLSFLNQLENINNVEKNLLKENIPSADTADTALEKKDDRFKNSLQPRFTLILSGVALIVSIFAIFVREAGGLSKLFENIGIDSVQYFINILNMGVSLIALIFIADQKKEDFKIQNSESFKSLAELNCKDDELNTYIFNLNLKVKELVNQFKIHIALFALSLFCVYLVIVSSTGDSQTVSGFRIATNLTNFSNALFILLAFSVFYIKTVDDSSEEDTAKKLPNAHYVSTLYWAIPVTMFVIYTFFFLLYSVPLIGNSSNYDNILLNRFDLFVGLANGLTMTLLFGKYVSIEQSLNETRMFNRVFEHVFHPFSKMQYRTIISAGIVFILPIYALAQPLFGSFKIAAFGSAEYFQTGVYAACLLGKICFLHLTYILISKKLFHLYFYGVTAKIGNFKKLEECFIKSKNEDSLNNSNDQ